MAASTIVVVIVVALLAMLALTGNTGSDSLIGLLGVIAGVAISGLSRHRSDELGREHHLRMAALEKHLQAHQEGYALWRRLIFDAHDINNAGKTAGECQEWWEKNCLYLKPRARETFNRALLTAATFPATKQNARYPPDQGGTPHDPRGWRRARRWGCFSSDSAREDSSIKRPGSSDA